MKKFCDNPGCILHIDVCDRILEYGQMSMLINMKERKFQRCEYIVNGKYYWLCDSCIDAIYFIKEAVNA